MFFYYKFNGLTLNSACYLDCFGWLVITFIYSGFTSTVNTLCGAIPLVQIYVHFIRLYSRSLRLLCVCCAVHFGFPVVMLFFFWKGSDALLAVTICLEPFWLPASNLYCPHEHACPLHEAFVFKGKTGSEVSVSMLRHCLINLATKQACAMVEFGSEGRVV